MKQHCPSFEILLTKICGQLSEKIEIVMSREKKKVGECQPKCPEAKSITATPRRVKDINGNKRNPRTILKSLKLRKKKRFCKSAFGQL